MSGSTIGRALNLRDLWGAEPLGEFHVSGALRLGNITSPVVIKPRRGRVTHITFDSPGSGGRFILNDCLCLPDVTYGNRMLTISSAQAEAVPSMSVDLQFLVGITLSAVPEGGVISVAFHAWD